MYFWTLDFPKTPAMIKVMFLHFWTRIFSSNIRFRLRLWLILGALFLAPLHGFSKTAVCPATDGAERESVENQFLLAESYDNGKCGFEVNKGQALHFYTLAAKKNHLLAAYELAETYFIGDGVPEDYNLAQKWYLKAAEQGHAPSQLRLGFLYAEKHFTNAVTDLDEAEKWFRKAAEQGLPDAEFRLGNFYNNYKEPRNPEEGYAWLKKAAEHGHRTAMFDLARMLLDGKGTNKDVPEGIGWMKKAGDLDFLQAQMALCEIYADGSNDVEKDPQESLKWTLKIAGKDTAPVFYLNKAGDIFFDGWEGISKDYARARPFYERAAQKNDRHALERLYTIFTAGLGIAPNPDRAYIYKQRLENLK